MEKQIADHDLSGVDEAAVKEMEASLKSISDNFMTEKLQETKLLEQSMAEGGPSSLLEAIWILIDYNKTSVRQLAPRVGCSRTKLARMLSGEIALDPKVQGMLTDILTPAVENSKRSAFPSSIKTRVARRGR